jgi:hypothetical protein
MKTTFLANDFLITIRGVSEPSALPWPSGLSPRSLTASQFPDRSVFLRTSRRRRFRRSRLVTVSGLASASPTSIRGPVVRTLSRARASGGSPSPVGL